MMGAGLIKNKDDVRMYLFDDFYYVDEWYGNMCF